nr:MAG TPA: hypothetical protein [Caudoviricetes sp.]
MTCRRDSESLSSRCIRSSPQCSSVKQPSSAELNSRQLLPVHRIGLSALTILLSWYSVLRHTLLWLP